MIDTLLWCGLHNAAWAAALAIVIWLLTRWVRQAPLVHALWLVVLVKLIAPPLVAVPILQLPAQRPTVASNAEVVLDSVRTNEPVSVHEPADELDPASTWQLPSGQTMLIAVWLLGTVAWFPLAAVRVLRFNRWLALVHLRPRNGNDKLTDWQPGWV